MTTLWQFLEPCSAMIIGWDRKEQNVTETEHGKSQQRIHSKIVVSRFYFHWFLAEDVWLGDPDLLLKIKGLPFEFKVSNRIWLLKRLFQLNKLRMRKTKTSGKSFEQAMMISGLFGGGSFWYQKLECTTNFPGNKTLRSRKLDVTSPSKKPKTWNINRISLYIFVGIAELWDPEIPDNFLLLQKVTWNAMVMSKIMSNRYEWRKNNTWYSTQGKNNCWGCTLRNNQTKLDNRSDFAVST